MSTGREPGELPALLRTRMDQAARDVLRKHLLTIARAEGPDHGTPLVAALAEVGDPGGRALLIAASAVARVLRQAEDYQTRHPLCDTSVDGEEAQAQVESALADKAHQVDYRIDRLVDHVLPGMWTGLERYRAGDADGADDVAEKVDDIAWVMAALRELGRGEPTSVPAD